MDTRKRQGGLCAGLGKGACQHGGEEGGGFRHRSRAVGLQTLSLTLPRGRRRQLSFLQVGGTAWPEPGGGRQAEQA